jgi:hypothetical protein
MPKPALLLPFALGLSLCTSAQAPVRIADPSALIATVDFATDVALRAGLKAAGLTDADQADVLRQNGDANWPIGLRTDSSRIANKAILPNFHAVLLCEYAAEGGVRSLVAIRAAENIHMPDELRSKQDFYLVFGPGGVQPVPEAQLRPKASKGPSWRGMRPAAIIQPDAIFATYDLGEDEEALAALEKQGMSPAEIEAVVFRSHERNWPDGIDSFDERYPRLKQFKRYKAMKAAAWGDKVLLVIPSELNRRMPVPLRPYIDIYMVYSDAAVKVKKAKR